MMKERVFVHYDKTYTDYNQYTMVLEPLYNK